MLDASKLRQFWLNTMLAQKVVDVGGYERGTSVVMACSHDRAAWSATRDVRAQLEAADSLRWAPYEALVGTLHNYEWTSEFVRRYLNFSPVADQLAERDPRRLAV